MAVSCHFAVATNWHGKHVKFHIWSPMTMQVRDYIATQCSCFSGAQTPVQGEGVDAWPLLSQPHLDNGPQMDLTTRDIWDLEMTNYRRHWRLSSSRWLGGRGPYPYTFHSGPDCRALGWWRSWYGWQGSGLPRGGGGDTAGLCSDQQIALRPMQMAATSSACSQLCLGWVFSELTPLVGMPLLGRPKCLFSSGKMRSSVSRTTTWRQWSERAWSIY